MSLFYFGDRIVRAKILVFIRPSCKHGRKRAYCAAMLADIHAVLAVVHGFLVKHRDYPCALIGGISIRRASDYDFLLIDISIFKRFIVNETYFSRCGDLLLKIYRRGRMFHMTDTSSLLLS